MDWTVSFNTLRPRQNGCLFADDIFKRIFLNENIWISITISLKFVPKGPINNIPALVQIMAWRRPGDKPLSEPMLVGSLTHICVTRPQWVKVLCIHVSLYVCMCIFISGKFWRSCCRFWLNTQWSCRWFDTPLCSCDVTVMNSSLEKPSL